MSNRYLQIFFVAHAKCLAKSLGTPLAFHILIGCTRNSCVIRQVREACSLQGRGGLDSEK